MLIPPSICFEVYDFPSPPRQVSSCSPTTEINKEKKNELSTIKN